jgi:hypothetical protein
MRYNDLAAKGCANASKGLFAIPGLDQNQYYGKWVKKTPL